MILPDVIESGLSKSDTLDDTPFEEEVDTRGSPRYDIWGPHGEKLELPPRWEVDIDDCSCARLNGGRLGVATLSEEDVEILADSKALAVMAEVIGVADGGVQRPADAAAAI